MSQANKLKGNEDGLRSMVSQMKDTLYLGNYTWLETRREWKRLVAVFPFEYSLLVSNFFCGEKYDTIKVQQSRHSAGLLLHMLKNMYSFALLFLLQCAAQSSSFLTTCSFPMCLLTLQ